MSALYNFEIAQRSPEWLLARAGIPTASQFSRLVTPTGKPARNDGVRTYLAELVAERLDPPLEDKWAGASADRGNRLENDAREWYELVHDVEVIEVGIVYPDDKRASSSSPDGLVGDDGGVEIKCLELKAHIKALLENAVPKEYVLQCQGNMWVTGRKWWDFIAYHPHARTLCLRVERDDDYMQTLDEVIPAFCKEVDDAEVLVRG